MSVSAVVVLGVQSAAAAASADKSPPAPVTLEHTDNVASASVTAKVTHRDHHLLYRENREKSSLLLHWSPIK